MSEFNMPAGPLPTEPAAIDAEISTLVLQAGAAPTPLASRAINARLEQLHLAKAGVPASGGPGAGADEFRALQQRALEAPTLAARDKVVADMERAALERAQAEPPAGEGLGPREGFEPPSSGLEYQFEQQMPPGVEITDVASLGAMKGALADLGVPAAVANGGLAEIAQLAQAGAYSSEQAYDDAVAACRVKIEAVHKGEAAGVIRDALTYLNAVAQRSPELADAVTHAMASPMAVQAAANMYRHGSLGRGSRQR